MERIRPAPLADPATATDPQPSDLRPRRL